MFARIISPSISAALVCMAVAAPIYAQQPWILGYYSAGNGNLSIAQIPWAKYTHVAHFAASTDGAGNVIPYYLTQAEISTITQSAPPAVKILVTIKDNDNNLNYFPQSASPAYVSAFVASIVNFVVNNGYDGVDLDWEKNINQSDYDTLLSQLRAAFNARVTNGLDSNARLITMAANGNNFKVAIDNTWQTAADGQTNPNPPNVDQVNVMCYDLDWGSSVSWFVDGLRNGSSVHPTCDWDISQFVAPDISGHSVPANKIGVGIPYYGRRWPRVTQPLQTANFSNATTFYYRDLVTDSTRWQTKYQYWDSTYQANYLSVNSGNLKEFDSYTGTQAVQNAVTWQQSQGFGGMMAYTIEYEHLSAQTCDNAFPLSTVLYNSSNPTAAGAVLTVVSATAGDNNVSLTWSACGPAGTAYNVYRSTAAKGPYLLLNAAAVQGTTFQDTTATDGTSYFYYVTALNSAGLAVGSSGVISATPVAPCTTCALAPTNLTATSPARKQIQLNWTASADASTGTKYEIWRSTVSGGPYTYIDSTTNTAYLNMGMGSGITYYYVVRQIPISGNPSPYSNEAHATSK